MSGPINYKAERPVSEGFTAVGALIFSRTATADCPRDNLFKQPTLNPTTVDRSLPLG